jgi:co-chaperonin GroES (HSP10)
MPVRENVIQLGELTHTIDWRKASRSIRVLKGRVAVEMLPEPDRVGRILLPGANANIRPDVGVVVASDSWAPGIDPDSVLTISRTHCVKGRYIRAPKPRTLVCVRPYDGTWLEDADCGDYTPQGQIRVYGTFAEYEGEPQYCNWWDSIICEAETLKPYGDKILFRLDPVESTQGGIILADDSKYRTGMATVEQVGPLVFDVKPGERVCVNLNHLKEYGLSIDGENTQDLAIGTELAIEYVHTVAA